MFYINNSELNNEKFIYKKKKAFRKHELDVKLLAGYSLWKCV